MARVEIYTKAGCSFCVRAKQLLEARHLTFEEYPVDSGGARKAEMVERAGGRTTVPQIFMGGRHIGGCDDLMSLAALGKLDTMLAEMGKECAPPPPAPQGKAAPPDRVPGGANGP